MLSFVCFCTEHRSDTVMMNGGETPQTEDAESHQNGNGDACGEESNEQEVIVIQDTGFTVKIQAPGTEPFDLQVCVLYLSIAVKAVLNLFHHLSQMAF